MILPRSTRRPLTIIVVEIGDDGSLYARANFTRDPAVDAGPNDTLSGCLDVLQRNICDSGALERARKV